jgi:TLD
MRDSTVLSHVTDSVRSEFLVKLVTRWLPGKRFELLYRGSRDDMTSTAFHAKCDNKGATLVLVAGQSERKPLCVFGGFAGKSWVSGNVTVDARNSFLFTVVNPFGDGVVQMPIVGSGSTHEAMLCMSGYGPVFGGPSGCRSLMLANSSGSGSIPFNNLGSSCTLSARGTFGDPLGHGDKTFTGARSFAPLELEVWAVL